jgi:hypothetical protein
MEDGIVGQNWRRKKWQLPRLESKLKLSRARFGNLLHRMTDQQKFSDRFRFADWPNPKVPTVAAGAYAVWRGGSLFYCGMSGRGIEGARAAGRTRYGLATRLTSHASGRLSGDQFCVYVANRLVIPELDPADLPRFATGEMRLDELVRRYIYDHLDYQYLVTETSREAFDIEGEARRGEVFGQKPVLNPA